MKGIPVGITVKTNGMETIMHPLGHLLGGQTQIAGAKRNIIENRGAQRLVVGILKHQADLAANGFEIFFHF